MVAPKSLVVNNPMDVFLTFFSSEIVFSILAMFSFISFIAFSSLLISFSCDRSVLMMLLMLSISQLSVSPAEGMLISSFDVNIDTREVMTRADAIMEPTTTCLSFLITVGMI